MGIYQRWSYQCVRLSQDIMGNPKQNTWTNEIVNPSFFSHISTKMPEESGILGMLLWVAGMVTIREEHFSHYSHHSLNEWSHGLAWKWIFFPSPLGLFAQVPVCQRKAEGPGPGTRQGWLCALEEAVSSCFLVICCKLVLRILGVLSSSVLLLLLQ